MKSEKFHGHMNNYYLSGLCSVELATRTHDCIRALEIRAVMSCIVVVVFSTVEI
jgi:hypothetical protein